jgi:predicted nucleic acid-binding protein
MTVAVLDTSALIRLYVPDGPLPTGLEEAIEDAWRGDGALMMPELALAEAAQVLWKKEQRGLLTTEEVEEILDAILDLPIESLGHRDLIAEALALAREHSLTAYDALFLAVAAQRKADLITADAALRKAFEKLESK